VQTAALGGINSKRVEKGKKAESSNGPWVHGLVIGYGHGSSSCFNKSFCCVEKQTTPLPFPLSHVPFSLSLHPHRKTHEPCRKIHQLAGNFIFSGEKCRFRRVSKCSNLTESDSFVHDFHSPIRIRACFSRLNQKNNLNLTQTDPQTNQKEQRLPLAFLSLRTKSKMHRPMPSRFGLLLHLRLGFLPFSPHLF
jgi:hypothetical protein